MEEEKRKKENQLVIKDNSLIQMSKLSMNLLEMKAFSYIIAQIPDFDNMDEDEFISFRQADFCRACEIEVGSGKNNTNLKQTLRKLAQRVVEINTKDKWVLFPVLSETEILFDSEKIKVKIHEKMKPLIYDLKERFTKYQLENVLRLKSKYAFRLYEWLKSFNSENVVGYIGKLKTLFCVNYKRAIDIVTKCIEPAVAEINAKTDLVVSFTREKTGRAITAVSFNVKEKLGFETNAVENNPSSQFKIVYVSLDGTPTTIMKNTKEDIQDILDKEKYEKNRTMIFEITNGNVVNITEDFTFNN